ncbi:MAG TPA: excinuclease ABC subunit UvrC [Fimbriimonadaceae bacterium]|nr:excinuclease ABC subunit UvrC [Fimbriimonadaceae bacterium]
MPKSASAKSRFPEAVTEKLKKLPAQPGCYIYRDAGGEVLYVGKALVLKNRVRSYFQESTRHGVRIARMVSRVADIEWIVVDSEVEALVLECNLIKKYRPPFNVRLRDDKSYPYIKITKEKFPRLLFTRKVLKDGAKYFGPYTSAFGVRDTLQLLHKIFPLIPCGKSWSGNREQSPCLYYHLGRCLAPCAGIADPEEYKAVIDKVARFLDGKEEGIVKDLKKEMAAAAEALDFEKAAKVRDQIAAIEQLMERQKVLSTDRTDQDVIAVVKDDRGAAIQMLYIRAGKLIGQRQFMLDGASEASPSEAVDQFVKQYYAEAPEVPREVLLPVEIEERNIVQSWLRQRRGAAVTVEVPQGGEKLRLVEMAATNAEHALSTFSEELATKEAWAADAMAQLQEALGLSEPPIRIEGYDISNIQGTSPVGSMVVVENGEAAKAEYRRFKVRYHPESPNDFAMMHEVLTRRLRAYIEGDEKFAKLPDLIMIDGGRGQLAAALKARDELGLTVPMVGLAKRLELIVVPKEKGGMALQAMSGTGFQPVEAPAPRKSRQKGIDDPTLRIKDPDYSYSRQAPKEYAYDDVELPMSSPGLMLLRKLRDEAHRFALTYHRKLRDKRTTGSALEEVPGVGPRRRRLLLRTFGSINGIRRASVEDLAAVPTMTRRLAEQIRDYLRED